MQGKRRMPRAWKENRRIWNLWWKNTGKEYQSLVKIIAIDPGDTLGWVSTIKNKKVSFDDITCGKLENPLFSHIYLHLNTHQPNIVIVEYDPPLGGTAYTTHFEQLGVVKMWIEKSKASLVLQKASEKNQFKSLDREYGKMDPHILDALKHLLVYLRREGIEVD